MNVSERTLNVWTIINLHKAKEFTNPNWIGREELNGRIMRVNVTEHWKLRVWKEYFNKFVESSRNEDGYVPDPEQ